MGETTLLVLKVLGITLATLIGIPALYRALRSLYDDWHGRWVQHRQAALTLAHIEQQNKVQRVRRLQPDEQGRLGVTYDGDSYRDLDNLRVYTQLTTIYLNPILEKVDAIHKFLTAGKGWPAGDRPMLPEQTPLVGAWDTLTRVPLTSLLEGPPSFRRLVLGVTVTESGQREIVTADMARLVHIAVGGSSGWGKSVFLRSLAFQLAKSSDPVDLAMIDLEGATLAPFATCDRLLWPMADTEKDAGCILRELTRELDRRKALFAEYPGVDSLYLYNDRASNPLDPLVCIIDEATALLENKEVEQQLRILALRARKFGLWVILAGQDWKASSLDTAIRNQLSTRVQFKAMSDSQSRVLLQRSGAENLDVQGRALAWIPGRELVTLQAPIISYDDILAAMNGHGPKHSEIPSSDRGEKERICELADRGLSKRQIALAVYGYNGGAAFRKVSEVLEGATTVADPDLDGDTIDLEPGATVVAGALDWCDFCNRGLDDAPEGVTFSECARCGVAVCSDCAVGSLCPDCQEGG